MSKNLQSNNELYYKHDTISHAHTKEEKKDEATLLNDYCAIHLNAIAQP